MNQITRMNLDLGNGIQIDSKRQTSDGTHWMVSINGKPAGSVRRFKNNRFERFPLQAIDVKGKLLFESWDRTSKSLVETAARAIKG